MKLVIQRVAKASVSLSNGEKREIGEGLLVLYGTTTDDSLELCDKLAEKTAKLRIFSDDEGKMNIAAIDRNLSVLVVSQFTLFADTKKGNRPSFITAARPPFAVEAYERYVEQLKKYDFKEVKTGEFGDDMKVELVNDGPVTIIMDTKDWA